MKKKQLLEYKEKTKHRAKKHKMRPQIDGELFADFTDFMLDYFKQRFYSLKDPMDAPYVIDALMGKYYSIWKHMVDSLCDTDTTNYITYRKYSRFSSLSLNTDVKEYLKENSLLRKTKTENPKVKTNIDKLFVGFVFEEMLRIEGREVIETNMYLFLDKVIDEWVKTCNRYFLGLHTKFSNNKRMLWLNRKKNFGVTFMIGSFTFKLKEVFNSFFNKYMKEVIFLDKEVDVNSILIEDSYFNYKSEIDMLINSHDKCTVYKKIRKLYGLRKIEEI